MGDPTFASLCKLLDARRVGSRAALICADALGVLAAVPAGVVDLIVADPPYHLSNGGTTNRGGRRVSVDKGEWDASGGLDVDHSFQTAWLALAEPTLARSGSLWVSGTSHCIFSVGFAMQQLGYHLLNQVTWCKTNPPRNLGRRTFTHATETLLWAAPEKFSPLRHFFDYDEMRAAAGDVQMLDWWVIPAAPQSEREYGSHTAQKPLELYRRVVRASARPRSIVLDPFAGSGTSGVAALEQGHYWIGVERDGKHFSVARRRIESVA